MKLFKKITNIYFWFNLVTTIKVFFKPKQKWLTETIPNSWKDKPELIRDILFECIIHFIEEENKIPFYNLPEQIQDEMEELYGRLFKVT